MLALGFYCLRGGDERQLFSSLGLTPLRVGALRVGALLLCAFCFSAVQLSSAPLAAPLGLALLSFEPLGLGLPLRLREPLFVVS
ncbi:MAG TPA: hypothetical protein VG294_04365 [Solirubrobacteraceae bacterium]|nr:hypothetical protein [Solirubrobacteraceae bacterium]